VIAWPPKRRSSSAKSPSEGRTRSPLPRQTRSASANPASTDTDANRACLRRACARTNTFQGNTAAYVSNGCSTPVDVRICLMKEGKGWNCGMTYGLAPQQSWSLLSFKATGRCSLIARGRLQPEDGRAGVGPPGRQRGQRRR
jgi:hypothetical protein